MFKKWCALLALSCLLVLLLTACGGGNASGNGSAPGSANAVHMNATRFTQSSITIKKGESITLINDDAAIPHIIANGTWANGQAQAAREAGAPAVENITVGGNSSTRIGPFTSAGTFKLYCTIHAGMNLTVMVE